MSGYRRLALVTLATAVTVVAVNGTVATAASAAPAFVGPTMIWRLSTTASRAVVKPGQRIGYTITVDRLQSPISLAERLCLGYYNELDCTSANGVLLSEPQVVDDLSGIARYVSFDHDATGTPGTIVQVETRPGGTVITAEPDTTLINVYQMRISFSVTVKPRVRPGTAIVNTAYVGVHVAFVSQPGPLTNCPLDSGGVPAECTAISAIPPASGGAQTGFGGMAGHVGNIGRTGGIGQRSARPAGRR